MSDANYTAKPYAMGDRPIEIMNPDGHGKLASDAQQSHNSGGLPLAIMEDFGDTPGGQLARAARMQRNAFASAQESMVAPNTMQIVQSAVIGGVIGAVIGAVADLVIHKLPIPTAMQEVLSHTTLTAGMIAGIHAAEKMISPKHVNSMSETTAKLIEQADSQTSKAYLEVLSLERKAEAETHAIPYNNVKSIELNNRVQQPQVATGQMMASVS